MENVVQGGEVKMKETRAVSRRSKIHRMMSGEVMS